MRIVLQRVSQAEVSINNKIHSTISQGLLLLIGVSPDDSMEDIEWLVSKILNLRIFSDENGKMNLSVSEIQGEIMVVSQFTLFASTKKGNRPSFIRSAEPEFAKSLYLDFITMLKKSGLTIKTGEFGADMQLSLLNNGPVTILLDSKNKE